MALAQSADAAFWLMLAALPVAAWVVLSDLKSMRIPNLAVLALLAVYALVGALTLPPAAWAWGWLHFAAILALGFVLTLSGGFGAGDAKFAAAMAPFVAPGDAGLFLVLLGAVALAGLMTHRIARRLARVRASTPDWASWRRAEFPMGLALGPALIFYLALASIYGR